MTKLTGRCLCGTITYECEAELESMTYCHCDTCRRVTGSAFNIGVGVSRDSLKVSGEVQSHTHTNGSIREFCPMWISSIHDRISIRMDSCGKHRQ